MNRIFRFDRVGSGAISATAVSPVSGKAFVGIVPTPGFGSPFNQFGSRAEMGAEETKINNKKTEDLMTFKITTDTITPKLRELQQHAQALPNHIKRVENELNAVRAFNSSAGKSARKGPLSRAERYALAARQIAAKQRLEREIKAFMGF